MNFSLLSSEVVSSLVETSRYTAVDAMKKKAIHTARDYDEFKNFVHCAQLKTLTSKELKDGFTGKNAGGSWNVKQSRRSREIASSNSGGNDESGGGGGGGVRINFGGSVTASLEEETKRQDELVERLMKEVEDGTKDLASGAELAKGIKRLTRRASSTTTQTTTTEEGGGGAAAAAAAAFCEGGTRSGVVAAGARQDARDANRVPDLRRRYLYLKSKLRDPASDLSRLFRTEMDVGTMADVVEAMARGGGGGGGGGEKEAGSSSAEEEKDDDGAATATATAENKDEAAFVSSMLDGIERCGRFALNRMLLVGDPAVRRDLELCLDKAAGGGGEGGKKDRAEREERWGITKAKVEEAAKAAEATTTTTKAAKGRGRRNDDDGMG